MKIGIYDMYLDALGGGEKYMLSIASHLSKEHAVDIFWDDETILKRAATRFSLDYSKITVVKNIFISPLSFFQKKKRMQSYDLIIYLSDGSIPFLFGRKNILHFQFPTPWVRGNSITTKIKLSRISKIITNSQFTKRYIDAIFGVASDILYPPCTLLSASGKKENIILTVGRLNILGKHNDFKKLEKMIAVFKDTIYPHHKDWKLVLVVTVIHNDFERVERWKKETAGLPIEILTDVSYETLQEQYKKAKIYWHAAGLGENIEKHPERAEHFGIAPVEAMSAGAVPVVINAGGIPEIVKHNKDGLIWNTEEELTGQTLTLITDHILRENLAKHAVVKARQFSEEAFNKKLETIITTLS